MSENQEDMLKIFANWGLILKDGTELHHDGGTHYPLSDGTQTSVYYWQVPVDLSQVAALTSGAETIPLV